MSSPLRWTGLLTLWMLRHCPSQWLLPQMSSLARAKDSAKTVEMVRGLDSLLLSSSCCFFPFFSSPPPKGTIVLLLLLILLYLLLLLFLHFFSSPSPPPPNSGAIVLLRLFFYFSLSPPSSSSCAQNVGQACECGTSCGGRAGDRRVVFLFRGGGPGSTAGHALHPLCAAARAGGSHSGPRGRGI